MSLLTRDDPPIARAEMAWLFGLFLLALVLRCIDLEHESLWYDEAFTMQMVSRPTADILYASEGVRDPGNPPGYFVLTRLWLLACGSMSVEAARALSAVTGALSVPAVWLLARVAGQSRWVALLASLLVALSPPLVYLGREARVFAMLATVATLLAACVARIERGGPARWAWVTFALLGAASVHLHYYGAFILATLGLHLAWWGWKNDRAAIGWLVISAVVVVALFSPYFKLFAWQIGQGASRSNDTWWHHLALMPLFEIAGRTLVWKEYGPTGPALATLVLVLTVFAPLVPWLIWHRPWPGVVLWWAIGLPVMLAVVSLKVPMIHSHYLAVTIPAVLLLIACAFETATIHKAVWSRFVPGLVMVCATVLSLGRLYEVHHKDDWRGLTRTVASIDPTLPVYCYEDIGGDPYLYYRPQDRVTRVLGRFWSEAGPDQSQMLAEPKGFWLVLYHIPPSDQAEMMTWLRGRWLVDAEWGNPRLRVMRCGPMP